MTGTARVGLSGWNYPAWKDGFYRDVPRREWLSHAARVFDTLEVNATFYGSMKPSTYAKWRDATPADFRFAIKGSRYVTHYGRLADARDSVLRQRDDAGPLAGKIVAVLWQTPARLQPDHSALARFLDVLRDWPGPTHAIEFRNSAWFTSDTSSLLARAGAANVMSDAADWPCWDAVTADLVYVRLHGHTRTYASAYALKTLRQWAERVRRWTQEGREVVCYFDNDAEGAAPEDAQRLITLLGEGEREP